MSPVLYLPATCELCGHWIPKHAGDCPRNGVHPSQWSLLQSLDAIKSNSKTNDHDHSTDTFSVTYQPTEDDDDFCTSLDPNTYHTMNDSHDF